MRLPYFLLLYVFSFLRVFYFALLVCLFRPVYLLCPFVFTPFIAFVNSLFLFFFVFLLLSFFLRHKQT